MTILRVEGWMEGADAGELLDVAGSVTGMIVLDLSELRSADKLGLSTLRQLLNNGAEMRHAHGYLQFLLDAEEACENEVPKLTLRKTTGNQCKPRLD